MPLVFMRSVAVHAAHWPLSSVRQGLCLHTARRVLCGLLVGWTLCCGGLKRTDAEDPKGRVAWTGSRITGSPQPPLPFVLQRAFTQLNFDKPVSIHRMPQSNRLVVCEQRGKIFSFAADEDPQRAELIADFNDRRPPLCEAEPGDGKRIEIYSLAFHPDFEHNRKIVVCYVVLGGGPRVTDGTHIASFELSSAQPLKVKLETERTILRFDAGGHNGCTVAFGKDGLLYISTGDVASPTPPDPFNHGQNVGDLYSAILRVDMDRPAGGLAYSIPADNPFVDHPGARGEIYAYGFRNPWRMSFDRHSGELWVGDIGWESWEMVYRVRRGGNYGWPIKEGPGDARPDAKPGPTPIVSADIALPHSEAASVTGGVVYHGDKLKDISGQYIFGDWVTRKFWAAQFDQQGVRSLREIAVGQIKPICFELDHDGELLILDYNSAGTSGIYRLVPNPAPPSTIPFPTRLSKTGLVSSTDPLRPAAGVAPYRIHASMWRDGAKAEYWLAIPGTDQATFFQQPQQTFDWFRTQVILPPGSVLAKTYWLETVAGDPDSRRPIETQIAHNVALSDWNYYTYRWNNDASDALLVSAGGETAQLEIQDTSAPEGRYQLDWSFAARSQCRTCHTPWRGETLGFVELQLRDRHAAADSWHQLLAGGFITADSDPPPPADQQRVTLVDPYDPSHPIEVRARSYLHANCAHCHVKGGNSSAALDVSFEKPLKDTGLIDTPAMRGDCQLDEARLIAAGSPERSVLLYRMAKLGSGRMPPIGIDRVDHAGVDLISRWIAALGAGSADTPHRYDTWLQQLTAEATQQEAAGKSRGRNSDGAAQAASRQLLQSGSGALLLASAIAGGRVAEQHHQGLIDQAMQAPPHIAELFEAWAADWQRVQRLGAGFDPQQVLELVGDAQQGRQQFLAGRGQCIQCHQIHGQGLAVGPDLSKTGSRYPQLAELLRHIADPSAEVADDYRAVTLLTEAGQVHAGRVLQRTASAIELQDASGRSHWIDRDQIELEQPSPRSLMPAQLLDAFTAQQAADLLAYLGGLK